MVTYDAVVVGLGGVGSFALRELSKRGGGGLFLGIERYQLVHGKGSSHGKSRIYRRAYFEHPSYVPWIDYSISQFKELEVSSGESLMQECGTLLIDAVNGEASISNLPPLLKASMASAEKHGIPVEFLDTKALHERFPQFHQSSSAPACGLLEPGGGFLRPEKIMRAALAEAMASSNVHVRENTIVESIKETSDLVEIRMRKDDGSNTQEEEVIMAKKVVISAGGWTGQLLPSWSKHLTVTRQVQGWLNTTEAAVDQDIFGPGKMPTWVRVTPEWPLSLYGIPCDPHDADAGAWLKVAIHQRPQVIEDPSHNPQVISASEIEETRNAATVALNANLWKGEKLPDFVDTKPCFYTMTKDGNYIIGVPQGMSKIFAVSGLSGHGFKMTPALGSMMADFALDEDLGKWEMDFCSPSRYGI